MLLPNEFYKGKQMNKQFLLLCLPLFYKFLLPNIGNRFKEILCVCVYVRACVWTHVHVCTHMCMYVSACEFVGMYLLVCIRTCMYICL